MYFKTDNKLLSRKHAYSHIWSMLFLRIALQLVHFGYEDTPVERQYPCIEKQYEYEIYH